MKILVAYDGSAFSDKALERAVQIANNFKAEMAVISVTPDLCLPNSELSVDLCRSVSEAFKTETQKAMASVAANLAPKHPQTQLLINSGDPVELILETAESFGADLIVLGSRGRHGTKRLLLGSVSGKVAEYSMCDVLIVK